LTPPAFLHLIPIVPAAALIRSLLEPFLPPIVDLPNIPPSPPTRMPLLLSSTTNFGRVEELPRLIPPTFDRIDAQRFVLEDVSGTASGTAARVAREAGATAREEGPKARARERS
jgi:hypothetical protein